MRCPEPASAVFRSPTPAFVRRSRAYCILIPASRITLLKRWVSARSAWRIRRASPRTRRSPAHHNAKDIRVSRRLDDTAALSRFSDRGGRARAPPCRATFRGRARGSRPPPWSELQARRQAAFAADGDDAKLAGLGLLADRDVRGEQEIEPSGHNVGRGGSRAPVRHVHHRHADAALEHLDRGIWPPELRRPASRSSSRTGLAIIARAPQGRRRSWPGCRGGIVQDMRKRDDRRDRLEILDRIDIQVRRFRIGLTDITPMW